MCRVIRLCSKRSESIRTTSSQRKVLRHIEVTATLRNPVFIEEAVYLGSSPSRRSQSGIFPPSLRQRRTSPTRLKVSLCNWIPSEGGGDKASRACGPQFPSLITHRNMSRTPDLMAPPSLPTEKERIMHHAEKLITLFRGL